MEKGEIARRSHARAKGDRSHDMERCRTLDSAARIVFGVSVMDRQIEDYLVDKIRRESGTRGHSKHVRKVRRMDFGARMEMARKYGMEGGGTLLDDIREVRAIRNAIAHSTADVNAGGTVAIGGMGTGEAAERQAEYDAGTLSEAVKKTERCNRLLSEAMGRPRETKFPEGGAR